MGLKPEGSDQLMEADFCLDVRGLSCPMPLLKTKLRLNEMAPGKLLQVLASDPGSARDIPAFIRLSQHRLEAQSEFDDQFAFWIRCAGSV